jgi:type I restriction enzyme S subunit
LIPRATPLSKVATIIMGQSPDGSTYNSNGEGQPLLNGPTEFGAFHPNVTLFTTDPTRMCSAGNLIFCVRGSTTGRMNWADRAYSLGRGVCSIAGKTYLDTKYLKYCLDVYLESLLKLAGGGTFPNLRQQDIKDFLIPYPDNRHKIASILTAYDDLIENNTRRIKILEEMAQNIYREWFVHFRYPGHEGVPMVDSELGQIPQGWEVKKLGELVHDIRSGIDPSTASHDTPYVGLEHIPRKSMTLTTWGDIGAVSSSKFRFQQGDILFGKIRPYFHKVVVAPFGGICSSDTIVLRATQADKLPIALSCVFSEEFVAHASATSQGTKMPRANWDLLSKYPVPIAPNGVLSLFNDYITGTISKLSLLVRQNQNLRKTRDLLLPKLLSGQLDVEELDIVV